MRTILAFIRNQIRHQEISLAMFLAAFALLKFPLQHHIALSRFQHYGICLYVWALGFLFQTIWSWRYLTVRGRACLISTGMYVGIFAVIFYQSPWLDSRMAVPTDDQELLRIFYTIICAVLGFFVSVFWLAWVLERRPAKEEKNT